VTIDSWIEDISTLSLNFGSPRSSKRFGHFEGSRPIVAQLIIAVRGHAVIDNQV